MIVRPLTFVACAVLALSAAVLADDKKDKETKQKLLGTWIGLEGPGDTKDAVLELAKDGKGTLATNGNKRDFTYEVDGDTIKATGKDKEGNERTQSYKITKLTAKELEVENDKGEAAKFKRKD
jgi:uncharacterized protein (TIGR03066 family)